MQSAILDLLAMPEQEKRDKGLSSTPREIYRQPETWQTTFQRFSRHKGAFEEFLAKEFREHSVNEGTENGSRPILLLVGAGTSDYVGKAIASLLRRRWGTETTAVASTELLTNASDYVLPGKRYLMVSFSRSGNSSEGVAVLEQMLERYPSQVWHLVITCNDRGRMAQLPGVFTIKLDESVNDKGLAMTSSFTNMVVAGQCLAHLDSLSVYEEIVETMTKMAGALMPAASDLASELAQRRFRRICFVGSGALHPIAEESALKVLELNAGLIPTLAQSHLGLRHGPLSFVDRETLVVSYLSAEEPRRSYDLDLLEEIRGKGLAGEIVIVASGAVARAAKLSGHVLELHAPAAFPDAYRPAVDIILGQLLGLFTSMANGITPDSPSTGAISRVVSHVRIHSA